MNIFFKLGSIRMVRALDVQQKTKGTKEHTENALMRQQPGTPASKNKHDH
jgi:hypothetical protein